MATNRKAIAKLSERIQEKQNATPHTKAFKSAFTTASLKQSEAKQDVKINRVIRKEQHSYIGTPFVAGQRVNIPGCNGNF